MKLFTNYYIERLRERNSSDIVLVENGKSITASELLNSSISLARSLKLKGVDTSDRVVMAVKPGVEFLQCIYANMMLGTVISIIDPEMGRDNYRAKFLQFGPSVVFAESALLFINEHPIIKWCIKTFNKSVPFIPRLKDKIIVTTGKKLPIFKKHYHISSLLKDTKVAHSFIALDEKNDFLITYTSGTLNEPKGVVHSYESVGNSIRRLSEILKENKDSIIATSLPHYALIGINAGVRVLMWNADWNAKEKLEFIEKNQVSTLFGPPSDFTALIELLKSKKATLPSSVKSIYLGSAPIFPSFLDRLIPVSPHVKITCLYGMTEHLLISKIDGREKVKMKIEGDVVGKPFKGVNVRIAEDDEIIIHSEQKFSRYWHEKSQAKEVLSGDLGKVDENGYIVLLGRKKDMMIRGNFNIYPALYEPTISKIKDVNEAVMIGIYNEEIADEEIVLVIESEVKLNSGNIMKKLESGEFAIDKEALPDRIVFSKIPRSGRQNKVDRKQLKTMICL